jgi:FlaA1/EpsC-like NDP-sugar epimerase
LAVARRLVRLPERVHRSSRKLKSVADGVRSRHLLVLDVLGHGLAAMLALVFWLDASASPEPVTTYLWVVGIIVAARTATNIIFGLYATSWRYASIGDMGRILACSIAGTIASATIVVTITRLNPASTGPMLGVAFWLMELALALAVLAVPRFLIRAASEISDTQAAPRRQERTLLYGAGWAGVIIARSAERNPASGVKPVGFLDDNPALKGRQVAGLTVSGGIGQLAKAKRRTQATSLLITMPRASGETVRGIVEAAMAEGLTVRTVPPVTDLIDGTVDTTRIRQVRVEDLLRRPLADQHAPAIEAIVRGRPVLVTGAAGSIGSELVRQLLPLHPSHIAMVDQAESGLYMLQRALEDRDAVQRGEMTISSHLQDVTDREAMRALMATIDPIVVFHAAAYKHVPMLEEHPTEAVRVNIGGTMSVVDAATEMDVPHFVLVSTDKAVRPSSVMGATKRAAEMIVADAARRSLRPYVSVRFGNVLGSNGSVIPVFQEQLEDGRPLTITHAEMTRYFMTIPEAAWLIIDAAALARSGDLFVLDMGEPVRIVDIADDLARLSGRDPASVPKTFVGLRPGEKMHEALFYDHENVEPTEMPKVLRSRSPEPPADTRADLAHLLALADAHDGQLAARLHGFIAASVAADEGTWADGESARETPHATSSERAYRPVVPVPVHPYGNGHGNGSANGASQGRVAAAGARNGHQSASVDGASASRPSVEPVGARSQSD